ncbi:AAA family ATPase [Candidatus Omnitrophota bacterium]
MGYTIAVCGKGGTGKTTIAGLIVSWLTKTKKSQILAVDADPNYCFAETLGLQVHENIGQIVDNLSKNPDTIPQGMSKQDYIDYQTETNLLEGNGFDVLVMGRPEGPGCYCYVNNVLRGIVKKLIDSYTFVVVDNEAGLEHLSRRTTRAANALFVVSDPSQVGIRSAVRIQNLIKELEIKVGRSMLLVNRADESFNPSEQLKGSGLEFIGTVPEDKELLRISIEGKSLLELNQSSAALCAVERICDQLWQ